MANTTQQSKTCFMLRAFFNHGMAGELSGSVPLILGFYKTDKNAEDFAKFARRLLDGFQSHEVIPLNGDPIKWQITGITANSKQYKLTLCDNHYQALEETKTLINRYQFEEVRIQRLDLGKEVING
ncbi:hypothetical protein ACWA5Z_11545 [Testudinibacter sp. P80/BLE/0925]|uniref:hypothetical protein n=1 Tax=Testudinibacter sp. TW-1 TaxID=3417757 RepID=UPI003D35A772